MNRARELFSMIVALATPLKQKPTDKPLLDRIGEFIHYKKLIVTISSNYFLEKFVKNYADARS